MPELPDRCRASPPLVIVGASVRALAASAARAGWAVHAADLYCDLDLQAIASRAVPVAAAAPDAASAYPWSLIPATAAFPPGAPCCYTGGLENHPDLLDAIAAVRPLAGNRGAVVRRLRDPARVAATAGEAGLSYPETLPTGAGIPLDGSFLVKPLAGAGGRGIRRWTAEVADAFRARAPARPAGAHVWQRCISGMPFSAAYCMHRGGAALLGWSRQLVGAAWCHAGAFAWCGAVTPGPAGLPGGGALQDPLERLGRAIARGCQPVGLIGVDLVVDAAGLITVLEINPRPTASMELLERAGAGSMAGRHLAACGCAGPPPIATTTPAACSDRVWSKAVLFASAETPVSEPLVSRMSRDAAGWTADDHGWPALADVPAPGQVIPAAAPVVTLFASGSTADDAVSRLRGRVAHIDGLLAAARSGG